MSPIRPISGSSFRINGGRGRARPWPRPSTPISPPDSPAAPALAANEARATGNANAKNGIDAGPGCLGQSLTIKPGDEIHDYAYMIVAAGGGRRDMRLPGWGDRRSRRLSNGRGF